MVTARLGNRLTLENAVISILVFLSPISHCIHGGKFLPVFNARVVFILTIPPFSFVIMFYLHWNVHWVGIFFFHTSLIKFYTIQGIF